MRLSALTDQEIKPGLVPALARLGIRTTTDLLFSACKDSAVNATEESLRHVFLQLPAGTCTLQELHALARCAIKHAASSATTARLLLEESTRRNIDSEASFQSGIPKLDMLLNGFGGARVLEITGSRGSGKTALALHIILRRLSHDPHASVLWVDTTGDSISGPRLAGLVATAHAGGPAASTTLDRLQLALAFDLPAAYTILDGLYAALALPRGENNPTRIEMVVIDAITPLLGPRLSAVSSEGHAAMANFMRQLRWLSRTFSVTFLLLNGATLNTAGGTEQGRQPITNPLSAFASTVHKPTLGPSFTFMTDGTLWLQRFEGALQSSEDLEEDRYWAEFDDVHDETPRGRAIGGGTVIVAEVFRSRYTRSKTWCAFQIDARGVPVQY